MLKTSSTKSVEIGKGGAGVDSDNRAGHDGGELDRSGMDNVEVDSNKVGDDEVGKKGQKTSKSKKTVKSDFLTLEARLAFTKLRQVFSKLQSFIILTRNVISGLRQIHQAMLLVKFSVS